MSLNAFWTPSKLQNLTEMGEGVYRSTADFWKKNAAVAFFDLGFVPPGAVVRASFSRQANFSLERRNWKVIRLYAGAYPNTYAGSQKDGSWIFYTEKLAPEKNKTSVYFNYPNHTGLWRAETWEIRFSSAVGKADAYVKATVGGKVILNRPGLITSSPAYKAVPHLLCIQDVYAPGRGDAGKLQANIYTSYKDFEVRVTY
jgi:hypothetical protein